MPLIDGRWGLIWFLTRSREPKRSRVCRKTLKSQQAYGFAIWSTGDFALSQFDWPGGPFESSSREDVLLSKDKVLEPCMGFKEAELSPEKIVEDVTIGFIPRYPPLTDMGVTIGASSVLCFCCFCTSRLKSTSDNVVKLI